MCQVISYTMITLGKTIIKYDKNVSWGTLNLISNNVTYPVCGRVSNHVAKMYMSQY